MIQPDKVFNFETLERSEGTAFAEWSVPADCPYLDGHFPGFPVMPAVGLLDGSIELVRQSGNSYPREKLTLKRAKITGMVTPGMKVRVSLLHKENRFEVEWRKSETREPLANFNFSV